MKINCIGCALIDNLYSPIDFKSEEYHRWSAENGVQNGIITGGLIFGDDLEATSGVSYQRILEDLTGRIIPEKNIGGPAVVAMIHMAQLLSPDAHDLAFYGRHGDDENGRIIAEALENFGIVTGGYQISGGSTPFTDVLCDPDFNDGNGERSFINYIGAAMEIREKDLPAAFFDADILIFGGTGLTPGIHDDLSVLLSKGRAAGALNCINTVYDFRNQKKNPEGRWPLVGNDTDFHLIDLLIADNEEAVKISGMPDKNDAAAFFLNRGVRSGIITHGADDIICFSDGSLFGEEGIFSIPVSAAAGTLMKRTSADEADTTGCGDNFAGGVYTSLVNQLQSDNGKNKPSLKLAAALGAVSGGFAGLYRGGVYTEKRPEEKKDRILALLGDYEKQTGEKYAG